MSSLASDDTPMLSDGALPPADALPQAAAAAAAGAPTGCAPVGPHAAMVALPQSPAALPTHMLAAWSSPSSAASSSSALLRAYAAASDRQLSSPSSSSTSSASSSASTSPISSRRSSFAEDDWALVQAEGFNHYRRTAPAEHEWRRAQGRRAVPAERDQAPRRSTEIGDQGEDTLALQLSRHPAVAVAVRNDTPDGKADLSVRLYGADVNQYRAVQIKASMQDNLSYFRPAELAKDYGDVVCAYVNYNLKIAFVGMGGCFVAAGTGFSNTELNASRRICLDDLELGHKQLCDKIVELLPKSREIGCTPLKLAPNHWKEHDSKLIVKSLQVTNLYGQYAAAPTSHSTEDCTIQSERAQLKARSKADYQLSNGKDRLRYQISHRVDGQAGVPYDPDMAVMLVDTRCRERIYWLTAEQAALEGITGVRKRWVSVTVYSPRDCPAGDPWRKYLYPRDEDLIAQQQKQQQQGGSAASSSVSAMGSAVAAELATKNVEQLQQIVAAAQAQILQIQVAQAQK